MVAVQKPRGAWFQTAVHDMQPEFNEQLGQQGQVRPTHQGEHMVLAMPGVYVPDMMLQVCHGDDPWFVIPDLQCQQGAVLVSSDSWQEWSAFVKDMGGCEGEAPVAPRAPRAPRHPGAAMPAWAQAWLGNAGPRETAPAPAGGTGPVRVVDELTEEQQMAVAVQVSEMRTWLAAAFPSVGKEFAIRVLGGEFTEKHRRKAWDALQAYARTNRAHKQCADHGIRPTIRFARADFDSDTAMMLASSWCSRLSQLWRLLGLVGREHDRHGRFTASHRGRARGFSSAQQGRGRPASGAC